MATNNSWNNNGSLSVAEGGTGNASFTAYTVLCGGTTGTGALQEVSGLGTAGQLLQYNGASSLPTWVTVSAGSGFGVNFSAYNAATDSAATGSNNLPADTEVFDGGADYNTTTLLFTAPDAGVYYFNGTATGAYVSGTNVCAFYSAPNNDPAASSANIGITSYYMDLLNWLGSVSAQGTVTSSMIANMDAADTFKWELQLSNGSYDILGGTPSPVYTYLTGYRIA